MRIAAPTNCQHVIKLLQFCKDLIYITNQNKPRSLMPLYGTDGNGRLNTKNV